MNKKKIILIAVAVVAVAGISIRLFGGSTAKHKVTYETATVIKGEISESITATGTIEPVTEVEVGTQVSGIIDKIYADYNSVVTKGQLIAEMDRVTLQSEVASQRAAYNGAKAEYEYQRKNYERNRGLHEKQLISDTDYEQSVYNYEKAKSSYESSQASLAKAERNLSYATITSPIDGVVINRAVEEGQTVASGFETPTLFTIAADLTQMQVVADVDEADIGQVADGQRVQFTVDAYPDDTFEGTVEQVRLEATTESSVVTYEVVITAYNPDLKLKPGLTANVTIFTLEKDDALAVPTKALRFVPDAELLGELGLTVEQPAEQTVAGRREIWVKKGQTLSARFVVTGAASGDRTEIVEGLSDGDVVAVGLTAASAAPAAAVERSPFMPSGPGGNKKK